MKIFNKQTLYILASFLSGFSIMVIELISSRIMAPIIGSSVFTWTSVIGLTLLGLAFGGWIGGQMADKIKNNKILPLSFLISSFLIFVIPSLTKYSDFITNSSDSILSLNLFLSAYLFLLPSCAIGTIQPLILKKYADDFTTVGSKYGILSAVWSIGSMLGVFLTGFFFISNIGSMETIYIVSIILFLIGVIFSKKEKDLFPFFLIFFILILFTIFFGQQKIINNAIIFQKETNYYNAKVIDTNISSLGQSRILFLDFDSHSVETKKINEYLYPEMYPVFSYMKKNIKDILVIGAGAYTIPKHFKDYYKNSNISVIEMDPEMINIGNKYFDLEKYKIETKIGDARILINKDQKKYDVIFGDAYNSFISVLWYLLTKEWNDNVKEKLNQNGIYAINFIGAISGDGSEFTKSVAGTFKLSFPNFYVFSFKEDTDSIQNIVLVGVNGDLPISEKDLIKKISSGKNSFLSKRIISNDFVLNEKSIILKDNFSPVEKLMSPLIKEYFSESISFTKEIFKNGAISF